MTQLYIILSAVGNERGQPIGLYYDPFKARQDFAAISDLQAAFTGNATAFLVAYEVTSTGVLLEVAELGRK